MTWSAFELSKAARRCQRVAESYGWEASSSTPDQAEFRNGEHYVRIHLSIHGGIASVYTDEGKYTGQARAGWACSYIRSHP